MKRTPPRTYFVTNKWHLRGVEARDLEPTADGYLFNWNLRHDRGQSFYGKLGGTAFETRADAVAAVSKKAEAKLRQVIKQRVKQIAMLERVIAEGIDSIFPPETKP